MNKPRIIGKSLISISLVAFFSCMSEPENPALIEGIDPSEEILELNSESGGENLRKGQKEYLYQERFSNQSIADTDADVEIEYPGFGIGQATFLGRSHSFFNQKVLLPPPPSSSVPVPIVAYTEASPVTDFFSNELISLGLDPDKIDNNDVLVSSVTTDGKGNAIYFNNVSNRVEIDIQGNFSFVAQVNIVGGTGRFRNATGSGTVTGNVDAATGKGNTIVRARIKF